ncbi:tetratricopeptide repeat protein [Sphaerospermopsis torques-reginae]|uniref:Tetratricopeptide repeat protein n=1 Tax=Sphaerospermopsis torques-reginae ITEP-024 TaxID=984208 RepID=A0ABX8WYF8_9CYAN|nr:tetratricopeptide repeat protein [Sphaerospermopsis torques-reginae]QYX31487.1 tetratricopeptide repeat protein [Sphaerospermopsis torques-reginae ITEP-024]
MPLKLSEWDNDLPIEQDEEYQAFLRTLRFTEGFALLFVRCSPASGEQLVNKVKADIHDQKIEILKLNKNVTNLYVEVDQLPNKNHINILFITGLESALYKYEEAKTLAGWSSRETHHYSWEGVPPILININQQRERFRDQFKICFVFLLPQFAIKYFIHRAPDFFDWRSGLFEFPLDKDKLDQELNRIIQEGSYEQYINLTPEATNQKILEIIEIIEHDQIENVQKAELFFELGYLQNIKQDYQSAISSFDKALEFKPDYHQAWYNRGISLRNLGRYEEAISSYDKALEIKPDYHQAWYNRGNSLDNLGRYEEAISSYDKALEIKPDYHQAWYNRGISLDNLGRYEEAISSYDKALEIKPDKHEAWNNRGISLDNLGRYEEAISSYDKALEFQPDDHEAWNNRGISLDNLGRYEEAISSYDKALEFQPDYHQAWYNRGNSLYNLGRYEEAISSYDKALEIKPDDHEAWYNRGNSLYNLGRYEEAISSYDKALEIKPDYHQAWYNKARVYALQGNIEKAIENLQTAIILNPDTVREWAKTNSDFDAIREDERFQALF